MNRHHLPAPPLPPGRPRLIVTGFMGTGKTECGREAARDLGLPFVDLDEIVEARAGMPIAEIFTERGEDGFRALEREAMADAARLSGTVVATGGGAVLDPDGFAALADGSIVAVLTADPGELAGRLNGAGGRPLLAGDPAGRIEDLLRDRGPAYAAAGDPLDTTGCSPRDVAETLASRYRAGAGAAGHHVRVPVAGPGGRYDVVAGERVLGQLGEEIRRAVPEAWAAVVTADVALEQIASEAAASLAGAGLRVARVPLPSGEAAKALESVSETWTRFAELGVDRTTVVVAVGGGAALDAAGFAAATFARGVPLANVPTTLLAMADASLGGKVAIDHGGAKNSVGAFHHPRLVVADPASLDSLPARDLRAGLAEVVKMAVTASPLVLDVLESFEPDRLRSGAALTWIIEQAVRMKAGYVGEDPGDLGLRHSLNLGHTIAHGIEAATDYTVPHGEAVAIGLLAETRLGESLGITAAGTADRLERLLTGLGLPVAAPAAIDRARVKRAFGSDKKRRGGQAVFVVPARGGAELLEDADEDVALSFLPQGVRS